MYQNFLNMRAQQEKSLTVRTKQIRQNFVKFMQKSIHPIFIPKKWTYMEIAKPILNITFRITIYLLGSYLTFTSLAQLILNYQSQPMKLQIKNMMNETAMSIPDYTLCIQADADLLFKSTKSMGNYTEAINLFIKNSTNEGVFKIDTDAIFAKETYIVVWKYLSMMYEGESLNETGKNSFDINEDQNDDTWIALKNVLLPNIAAFNITLDQLKSTFDGKIKNFGSQKNVWEPVCLLQLGDDYSLKTDCSSSSQNITFIGTGHLCFKVHGQKIVYSGTIFGGPISPTVSLDVDDIKGLKKRNPSLTIDLSGRWTPPDLSTATESNEIIEYKYDQWITIHTSLPTVMKSMAYKNGKRVCSNEYTLMECLNKCRIQLIRNICGCLPATIPTKVHERTNELCTFEKYGRCLKYMGDEDNECKAQCVPNCEKWNYEYDVELYTGPNAAPGALFSCDSFSYVIFTEIPKWSFEEFVGVIGGALGLYLGLDFIILLQFVFNPIFMLLRRCVSSKNAVVNTETRQILVSTGDKRYFEKFREFMKNRITTRDNLPRSMFTTYLIEKLFWIVLYAAGGIHTAYLCYGLCQQYADNPPYSNITLMNNKTITLPKPTLCMQHYGDFGKKLHEITIIHYNNTNYTDFLTEYFDQENMTGLTLLNEKNWPLHLLVIVSQYFSIMNTVEANAVSAESGLRKEYDTVNIKMAYRDLLWRFSESTEDDIKHAVENVFEPSLKRLNVTIDEVRLKLGYEIAKLVRMRVNFVKADSTTTSLIDETKLTFIGYYHICFQLPFDTILYSDTSEYIEVFTDMSKFPVTIGGFYMDFEAYLTQLESVTSYDEFGSLHIHEDSGENMTLSVGILSHYKMISQKNKNAECSTDRSKEVCLATCRVHLIQALCDCTPITWPNLLTSNTNLCTLSEYSQCLNYNKSEDRECREKCAVPCERYNFFHEVTEKTFNETARGLKGPAYLRFYVKDFVYILFEDQLQWTLGDFLASLGGMLGLWLGLNIYTVANFLIIIPISLMTGLCARTKIAQKLLTPLRTHSEQRIGVFTRTRTGQVFCRIFNLTNQDITTILTVKWFTKYTLITIYSLAGIFLTYRMCADIIYKYGTDTESSYNLTENGTINFISDPSVCMPHSVNLARNQTADESNTEDPIQTFSAFITNNDSLLLGNLSWPKSFLKTVISFILFFGKYERVDWHQQSRKSDNGQSPSISQLQLFEVILVHMDATNTSMNDLMQNCGREVRKADNITVRHQLSNDSVQNIDISKTTYIDETTICYRLPFKEFSSRSEYIEINFNLDKSNMDENYLSEIAKEAYYELSSPGFIFKSYSTQSLSLYMKLSENANTSLKIEIEYNSLKTFHGTQRCSDSISQEDCKRNCKFQAVRQLCSCSPLSWSNTIDNVLERCSVDQYKTCLPLTFNTSRRCMSECLRPCKGIRFRERKIIRNANEPHQANLIIRMESFNFPMVTESPKRTWSEFQGDFGGALSLWIAFDALIIANALYLAVGLIFRLYSVMRRFKQKRLSVAPAT